VKLEIAKVLPVIRTALLLSAVATLGLVIEAHAQFAPLPIGTATVDVDPCDLFTRPRMAERRCLHALQDHRLCERAGLGGYHQLRTGQSE
jgi:hypothetical protein